MPKPWKLEAKTKLCSWTKGRFHEKAAVLLDFVQITSSSSPPPPPPPPALLLPDGWLTTVVGTIQRCTHKSSLCMENPSRIQIKQNSELKNILFQHYAVLVHVGRSTSTSVHFHLSPSLIKIHLSYFKRVHQTQWRAFTTFSKSISKSMLGT